MSMVTITIICERLWALRGLVANSLRIASAVVGPLQKGNFKAALSTAQEHQKAPAGRVFRDVISQQEGESLEYLAEVAEDRRFEEVEALKGGIWVLGTVGVSAPFIGLLGTVIGIIKSFHSMAIAGSGGFAVVAGGISEALVATALGLAVAIVAVIFYNYFHTKLERIEAVMTIGSDRLLEAIRLGRKAHGNG
jgi:biopolymer transport protein ExbB